VRGAKHLDACVRTVTPQLAREWMKNRTRNRSLSATRIKHYAMRMRNGEWKLSQPIMFNDRQQVFDGQHRLKAVIEANVPVEFLCISGYPSEETFGVVDDVRARKLRDWLHLAGEENPEEVAALLRYVALFKRGMHPSSKGIAGFSAQEGMALLEEHPELRECVRGPGVTANRLVPKSLSAFLYWRFSNIDKSLALTFFPDLIMAQTNNEGPNDPLLRLHAILRRNREAKSNLPAIYIAAVTIKAWNALRTGSKITQLKYAETEKFPEIV
jgi:hypothetical protein